MAGTGDARRGRRTATLDLGAPITLISRHNNHFAAVSAIGMPEERGCVKGVFSVGAAGSGRVGLAAAAPSWWLVGLLTGAVAGTWLPLVRCAARCGVHGHAFAIAPRIGSVGVAWCCSA